MWSPQDIKFDGIVKFNLAQVEKHWLPIIVILSIEPTDSKLIQPLNISLDKVVNVEGKTTLTKLVQFLNAKPTFVTLVKYCNSSKCVILLLYEKRLNIDVIYEASSFNIYSVEQQYPFEYITSIASGFVYDVMIISFGSVNVDIGLILFSKELQTFADLYDATELSGTYIK